MTLILLNDDPVSTTLFTWAYFGFFGIRRFERSLLTIVPQYTLIARNV